MKPLKIISIQRNCVDDGPGVRTTVFLKGCSLKCPWCCNPEAISYEDDFFTDNSKCLHIQGKISSICTKCERANGSEPTKECILGVAINTSQAYDVDRLLERICEDEELFKYSGGGVTFSGGEPLLFTKDLLPLFNELSKKSISIYVETSLFSPIENIKRCIKYIDGALVDLKLQPETKLANIEYYKLIKENIEIIKGKQISFRLVFVDSMDPRRQDVVDGLKFLGIKQVELIKCHDLAKNKYTLLGLEHTDYTANETKYQSFSKYLLQSGFDVKLLKI